MEGISTEQHRRQIAMARAVGGAGLTKDSTINLRIDIEVFLADENFTSHLSAELREMGERLRVIRDDLEHLANVGALNTDWNVARFRLANRGLAPSEFFSAATADGSAKGAPTTA